MSRLIFLLFEYLPCYAEFHIIIDQNTCSISRVAVGILGFPENEPVLYNIPKSIYLIVLLQECFENRSPGFHGGYFKRNKMGVAVGILGEYWGIPSYLTLSACL